MTNTKSFHVIAGVEYEIENVTDQPTRIAQWFHRHYAHTETRPKVEKEIKTLAKKNGYYEVDDRIYVLRNA